MQPRQPRQPYNGSDINNIKPRQRSRTKSPLPPSSGQRLVGPPRAKSPTPPLSGHRLGGSSGHRNPMVSPGNNRSRQRRSISPSPSVGNRRGTSPKPPGIRAMSHLNGNNSDGHNSNGGRSRSPVPRGTCNEKGQGKSAPEVRTRSPTRAPVDKQKNRPKSAPATIEFKFPLKDDAISGKAHPRVSRSRSPARPSSDSGMSLLSDSGHNSGYNSGHNSGQSRKGAKKPRPAPRPENVWVIASKHSNTSSDNTSSEIISGENRSSHRDRRRPGYSSSDDASLGSFVGEEPMPLDERVEEDTGSDEGQIGESTLGWTHIERPGATGPSVGTSGTGSSLPTPHQRGASDRTAIDFPDDAWWQKGLRYFRLLPPVRNEGRTKRKVRIYIWCTLLLDFIVALVAILSFGDSVTMCCRVATMASIPGIDWNLFMQVISYIYLVGIILEVHPVVREGPIPWNLLNPIFGSSLSFAVFVDDSKAEAISIWLLECCSVVLEFLTYLKLKKLYNREERRIDKLSENIQTERDKVLANTADAESGKAVKRKEYKRNAFLRVRERRNMRIEHTENAKKLHYHFVGVTVNFCLVCLTLLLIVFVSKGGGMCLVDGEGLDLFNSDQKARCHLCAGAPSDNWKSKCEVCVDDGTGKPTSEQDPEMCYYPYF